MTGRAAGINGPMAFLSRRLVRWALMALAVPLLVWVTDLVAERVEDRRGRSTFTWTLRVPGRWRRGEPVLAE